jgi:hypothetical protein
MWSSLSRREPVRWSAPAIWRAHRVRPKWWLACRFWKSAKRREAGPFYKQEPGDASALFSWNRSYTSLRPPSKFPEEWRIDLARAGLK